MGNHHAHARHTAAEAKKVDTAPEEPAEDESEVPAEQATANTQPSEPVVLPPFVVLVDWTTPTGLILTSAIPSDVPAPQVTH